MNQDLQGNLRGKMNPETLVISICFCIHCGFRNAAMTGLVSGRTPRQI